MHLVFAMFSESVICSFSMTSSASKLLKVDLFAVVTLRSCFHIDLKSLKLLVLFDKYCVLFSLKVARSCYSTVYNLPNA